MKILKIGDLYQENRTEYIEGTQFNNYGSFCSLELFYSIPELSEIEAVQHGNFKIGVLEINNILVAVYNLDYDTSQFYWGDNTYSYHNINSEDLNYYNFKEPPISIDVALVNAMDGRLAAIRRHLLNKTVSEKIYTITNKQRANYFSPQEYYERVTNIYQQYSTNDLVKLATFY